ncbi:proteinase inhibitor I4 serpin [Hymenobacter busanensis]|uniref:Proteinase inhibitor I4 serpin n=1 Tax=Hymenobacter busanensis TaxID=2607656 RepID=A0A7L5A4Q1_9BACT|nr:BPTI/Kunitz domain-containing protein [Hymenobacter busanensis]KAA9338374.1 proteinase inhibitor I4 serpin [Hymenobacter busanensis]QHJ09200.1 proteinase inhibitor I4 serpin [Hymenobacter busanensis]
MKQPVYALLLLAASAMLSCKTDCAEPMRPAKCSLQPDPGVCNAYMPRYYYDTGDGRCKEFIWGGCGGVVPFQTLQECKDCGCEDAQYQSN